MAAEGVPEWRFSQCFGEKDADQEFSEADVLSAVEFDKTGDYLATGDKGGRIVVFERSESKTSGGRAGAGGRRRPACEYKFYTEFQSHEPEFDYLKSLEIEEKINQINWCQSCGGSLFLLSTNDKTIKLWKVFEKKLKVVSSMNLPRGRFGSASTSMRSLKIPTLTCRETAVCATPRRVYPNAHAYHVNSISANSDGETFLSADDLRINLWHLDNSTLSFNIVDIKPENMEELTEVITASCFHPKHCNIFMYSSSRGSIRLADMRDSALCDAHSKLFEDAEDPKTKTFFSEIIASISDVKFTQDGNYILARDYLTLKVWDIRSEAAPVSVIPIHEHLRPKLCDLYENDCIFDKFECVPSGDGKFALTGSYHNIFNIYDVEGKSETSIEVSKVRPRPPTTRFFGKSRGRKDTSIDVNEIDFSKKVLHFSWHPSQYCVAVAGLNNLYIFHSPSPVR